jgi:hypothetical protein
LNQCSLQLAASSSTLPSPPSLTIPDPSCPINHSHFMPGPVCVSRHSYDIVWWLWAEVFGLQHFRDETIHTSSWRLLQMIWEIDIKHLAQFLAYIKHSKIIVIIIKTINFEVKNYFMSIITFNHRWMEFCQCLLWQPL